MSNVLKDTTVMKESLLALHARQEKHALRKTPKELSHVQLVSIRYQVYHTVQYVQLDTIANQLMQNQKNVQVEAIHLQDPLNAIIVPKASFARIHLLISWKDALLELIHWAMPLIVLHVQNIINALIETLWKPYQTVTLVHLAPVLH